MTEDAEEETVDKSLIEMAGDVAGELTGAMDGIPKPLKKGFFKACNQLGTAWLEGKAIEIKATSEARALVTKGVATMMVETGQVPEGYTQLAMEKQASKIVRKRLNLDKILYKTKEVLQENKDDNLSENQPEISHDWLNSYEDIAENMSSEEMQLRFAKILAGEIKKPSSFSIKSVKMLSEIDTNTAILFAKLCGCSIVKKFQLTGGIFHYQDVRLVAMGGQLGANCMQKFALGYAQLTKLQENGLISSELNSYMQYGMSIISPTSNKVTMPLYYQNNPYALRQQEEKPAQQSEFKIHGVSLTTAGTELYSVIDAISNDGHFEELKTYLLTQKLILEPVNLV